MTSSPQAGASGYEQVFVGSDAIKWGKRQVIAPVSRQGQTALHLVGGLYKLGITANY